MTDKEGLGSKLVEKKGKTDIRKAISKEIRRRDEIEREGEERVGEREVDTGQLFL